MKLYELMGIKDKDIVSVVGAGGKTSLCQSLSKELEALNKNILLTTTTAIYRPDKNYHLIVDTNIESMIDKLKIKREEIPVAALHPMNQNKLKGIPTQWVNEIQRHNIFDNIIVEADGARGKSLKFYGHHEPQIPSMTNKVIVVIGADCFYKDITSQYVHRHEELMEYFHLNKEEIITPRLVYNLIKDKQGLTKDIPKTAQKFLVINKLKGDTELKFFHEVVSLCKKQKTFDGYFALDLNYDNSIKEFIGGD